MPNYVYFVCVMFMMMAMMQKTSRPPSHTHLPCLVIVFDLTQIPAAGLGDPLSRHQIPDHHRRRTDLWRRSRETGRELGMNKKLLHAESSRPFSKYNKRILHFYLITVNDS